MDALVDIMTGFTATAVVYWSAVGLQACLNAFRITTDFKEYD